MLLNEDISDCPSEEADQRIVRHVINCARNNISSIVVSTSDTDVLILLMSVFPLLKEISQYAPNLVCLFGIGEVIRYYNAHGLCETIDDNVCKALPFFHAFTGCDSSMVNFSSGILDKIIK